MVDSQNNDQKVNEFMESMGWERHSSYWALKSDTELTTTMSRKAANHIYTEFKKRQVSARIQECEWAANHNNSEYTSDYLEDRIQQLKGNAPQPAQEKEMTSYEEVLDRISNLTPFIKYLESTTDSDWQLDTVRDKGNTKNCVMGHLVNWFYGQDYKGNIAPAWDAFEEMWATTYMIYPVNDGHAPGWMAQRYDQATPKERVVAYLRNLRDGKEKTTQQLMVEEK